MNRTFTVVDHTMPILTGLRGLAALWVLLYHAWVDANPREILLDVLGIEIRFHILFSLGWAGVQVLFVLSAFLLTLPFVRAHEGLAEKPVVLDFLKRRVARVFPAFHVQLLILSALILWSSGALPFGLSELPHYLLMLFVPPPVGIGSPYAINGVWWTLPIELSFYLALPLLAILASWHRRWLLCALCLGAMLVWRYFVTVHIEPAAAVPMWVYQLPGAMDSFGIGMLGAILHVHCVEKSGNVERYLRILALLVWLVPFCLIALALWLDTFYLQYWQPGPLLFLWTPLFSLCMIVVVLKGACAGQQGILGLLLANPVIFYMGTVSYGIYLWHLPISRWVLTTPLLSAWDGYVFPILAAVMVVLSVVAASLSWFLVERHVIALAKRNSGGSARS